MKESLFFLKIYITSNRCSGGYIYGRRNPLNILWNATRGILWMSLQWLSSQWEDRISFFEKKSSLVFCEKTSFQSYRRSLCLLFYSFYAYYSSASLKKYLLAIYANNTLRTSILCLPYDENVWIFCTWSRPPGLQQMEKTFRSYLHGKDLQVFYIKKYYMEKYFYVYRRRPPGLK